MLNPRFDGRLIFPYMTPDQLDMENGDIIGKVLFTSLKSSFFVVSLFFYANIIAKFSLTAEKFPV